MVCNPTRPRNCSQHFPARPAAHACEGMWPFSKLLCFRGIIIHVKAAKIHCCLGTHTQRPAITHVADFRNKIIVKLRKSLTSDWTPGELGGGGQRKCAVPAGFPQCELLAIAIARSC